MKNDKRCETCVNKDAFGKTFCAVCENGDMYKQKGKNPYYDYAKAEAKIISKYNPRSTLPITNVIFAAPATIVFWNDGTKSVVKCENEVFDPEKGLAMAIAKRALGNKGNYYETFKKWVDPYVEKQAEIKAKEIDEYFKKRWSIWFRTYDIETGEVIGEGVYFKTYSRRGDAVRVAKKVYGNTTNLKYVVARENPWSKN